MFQSVFIFVNNNVVTVYYNGNLLQYIFKIRKYYGLAIFLMSFFALQYFLACFGQNVINIQDAITDVPYFSIALVP